jgi:hypothetical protein
LSFLEDYDKLMECVYYKGTHSGPTEAQFVATLYEMLDEYNWGAIDWYGEDKPDFLKLLHDAWERAKTQRV